MWAHYTTSRTELARSGQGRFPNNPMKAPQPCGGKAIKNFRTIHRIGQDRSFAPDGWQARMTTFMKSLIEKGEDPQSIIILTETEFPHMANKISEKWVRYIGDALRNRQVQWSPPQDLQNDGFAGDIVTDVTFVGCGSFRTGNPDCFVGWRDSGGGLAYCPFRWALETGLPMLRRPDHGTPDDGTALSFNEHVKREMQMQAQDTLGRSR
ncbi:MAG: hypothetical protein Q9221_007293, partial [Calogaya cf. arnoldii]